MTSLFSSLFASLYQNSFTFRKNFVKSTSLFGPGTVIADIPETASLVQMVMSVEVELIIVMPTQYVATAMAGSNVRANVLRQHG